MVNSLQASTAGLAIVDQARQRRGWTKTSTARWWQDAHTSRATLRRFWQGERIQREIFIAICAVVGISNWEAIAEPADLPVSNPTTVSTDSPPDTVYLDLDEAPDLESFYGRSQELQQLEQWIVQERCRLVAIAGMGGIGKTSLALALVDRIQANFESVIWRSMQPVHSSSGHRDNLFNLVASLLISLDQTASGSFSEIITNFSQYLRQHRCLLILDGLDSLWETQAKLEVFNQIFQRLSQTRHQSCLLLTSRGQLPTLELNTETSRSLHLQGLKQSEAYQLLQARGLPGNELGLSTLIRLYRGNPLALKIVTPLIQSAFNSNVAAFLNQNILTVGNRLRTILQQQIAQITQLEQDILYWLCIWQEPVSFCRLQSHFLLSPDPTALLEGLIALEQRSLVEKWFSSGEPCFGLQPLVMKVGTDVLIEQAIQELCQAIGSNDIQPLKVVRTHWLLRPGTDDIAGDRILTQLREKLWQVYGPSLSRVLQQILLLLKDQAPLAIGYSGCNLMALLQHL